MTIVRVRDRGQITLPKTIRKLAKVEKNTTLFADTIGKTIILRHQPESELSRLQRTVKKAMKAKGITLKQVLKEIREERKGFNARYYDI